jgi:hypothetical protein
MLCALGMGLGPDARYGALGFLHDAVRWDRWRDGVKKKPQSYGCRGSYVSD